MKIKDFEGDIIGKTMIYTRKRFLREAKLKEATILDANENKDYVKILLKGEFGRELSWRGWISVDKIKIISIN